MILLNYDVILFCWNNIFHISAFFIFDVSSSIAKDNLLFISCTIDWEDKNMQVWNEKADEVKQVSDIH